MVCVRRAVAVISTLLTWRKACGGVGLDAPPSNDACAQIADLCSGTVSCSGIPGRLAYDCLRSMPFRPDLATAFLDHYRPYLRFHSTLDALKDPPPTYISTAKDLDASLNKIRARSAQSGYSSHYDFESDLNHQLSLAHDGHLQLELCSLQSFRFTRDLPLVSLSNDGLQAPSLYVLPDAELMRSSENGQHVSPVVKINGKDAVYFLESDVAMGLDMHDPDARYNHVFPSAAARLSGQFSSGAWVRYKGLWPGAAAYTLEFANGTAMKVDVLASWEAAIGPMVYKSGSDLFGAVCADSTASAGGEGTAIVGDDLTSAAQSYPESDWSHEDAPIKVHYLDHAGMPDTAAVQVLSFATSNGSKQYADASAQLLNEIAARGKTRLVVDVTDNLGGDLSAGLNLFRLLFPNANVHLGTRFRVHDLIDTMGQIFTRNLSPGQAPLDLPLVPQDAVDPTQKHAFDSWNALYGPHESGSSNMSNLYGLFDFDAASRFRRPIAGYGSVARARTLFKSRNIVILTNGRCASTCAVFVHQMMRQGVRVVVFGGRPRYGPAQAIGGNRGAQFWSLATIGRYVNMAHELALNVSRSRSSPEDEELLARMEKLMPPRPESFPVRFDMHGMSGINFRSAYDGFDEDTPLQMRYQAADCRRFYTLRNIMDPGSTWIDAAETMFYGGECVPGSAKASV
ncbi:unnamed protein product [Zymoseptoria tritici ST99CH_1A5]|uniref:Uncharacterized protein n=1 Tax=Zymoseptoria tritici ST99CH_1A5 TaxID=1276529 RepID=A0A1Y6LME4_ZYMTR|nr:unnamed protein product [Zymoseptoria tritici ST99CH_1A5]